MYRRYHLTKKDKGYYNKKKYENPFFNKNKKSKSYKFDFDFNWRFGFVMVLLIVFLIALFWLFFFSGFFKIKNIEVDGLSRINESEIISAINKQADKKKMFIFSENNLFIFNKDGLIEELKENYSFEDIQVDMNFPGGIKIFIQEKPYAYIWNLGDSYYYSDIEGNIIQEVNPIDIKNKKLPLITNLNSTSDNNYENTNLNLETSNYIIELFKKFKDESLGLNLEKFLLDDEKNTVKVKLLDGPSLYFTIDESQDEQLKRLLILKNEKLKNDFNSKEYIDLRYGERVYYR